MNDARHWSALLGLPSLTTTACGLACFATTTAIAKDPCCVYRQDEYTRSARYSINMALEAQTLRARVLTYTLWNYHFHEDSDELRTSGRAQLDRLVRRFPYACPDVFVQSAHDFRVTEGDMDAYFERRKELDVLRTQTVSKYLQRMLQGQSVAVLVHDRPPVGMSADETRTGYASMIQKAPSGLLPLGITASRFEFGAGGTSGNFDFGTGGLNSSGSMGSSPFSPPGGDGSSDMGLPPPFSSDIFSGTGGGPPGGPPGGPGGPGGPPGK